MAEAFLSSKTDCSSSDKFKLWLSPQWLAKDLEQAKESLQIKHIRIGLTGTIVCKVGLTGGSLRGTSEGSSDSLLRADKTRKLWTMGVSGTFRS